MLLIAAVAVTGCGGSDEEKTPKTSGAGKPIAKQNVERYVADFDAAQAKRLFAGDEEGIDPDDLVGKWEMQVNTTLGILEIRAPDGGGPVLDLIADEGGTFTLSERSCDKPFVVRVTRTPQTLTLTRKSGRCDEVIDLLVEEPWRRQR